MSTVLVVATVVVAGAGPFVAVHIGGKAYDFDEPETEPETCTDDTTQIERITNADPYSY